MDENEIKTRIGEAWKAHYQGDHQVAVQQFEQLLQEFPNHIDVQWGLGLSYRKLGNLNAALEAFRRVQELVAAELDETEVDERGRLAMLSRMVSQQIEQMSDFIA